MSKIFREVQAVEFASTLGSIDPASRPVHRSGSAQMQSGIQAMFEKAKREGFAAGHLEGLQIGHQDGLAQGLQEFELAHRQAIEDFRHALADFAAGVEPALEAWFTKAEESLASMAVEIARRALCRELEASRESVLDIARQALNEVRHGTEVRVKVNPIDSSILESRKAEILEAVADIRQLVIVPDLKVVAGCQVETEGGVIDATVEGFLARLEENAA